MYSREQEIEIAARIAIDKETDEILKRQKNKLKLSKAKLACIAIQEYYRNQK
jgi:hypothetical protein